MTINFKKGTNNIIVSGIQIVEYIPQPVAPTSVQAVAGDASVALSWTAAAEDILDYYDITRSTTSGTGFASITNVTATSYIDTGGGSAYY